MGLRGVVGAALALTTCLLGCSGKALPVQPSFTLQSAADRPVPMNGLNGEAFPLGRVPDLSLLGDTEPISPAFGNAFDGYVGSVSAVGPLATFEDPSALTFVSDGRLYVADGPCIRCIAPDAQGRDTASTVAGDWSQTGSVDGPVFQARFGRIWAMAGMPDGALIVADGYRLRRIAFDGLGGGLVTTIAGTQEAGYADGNGADARFDVIVGLAVAPDGTIVASEGGRVRQITYDATTGQATVATLYAEAAIGPDEPASIERLAVAADGAIWLSTAGKVKRIRRGTDWFWRPDLEVVGTEPSDRPGEPAGAAFTYLSGLGVLPGGDVVVHDSGPQPLVRRISVDGGGKAHISTLARQLPFVGPTRYGSWLDFGLSSPNQLAVGPRGEIRLLDYTTVRSIEVDSAGNGTPKTYAGWPLQVKRQDGPIAATSLHVDVVVSNGHGGYYVTVWNTLWEMELTPMGGASTRFLAGHQILGKVDGVGAQARFDMPNGLLRLPDGSLIVSDSMNTLLRRVTFDANGIATVTTLAGGGHANYDVESLTTGDGPALSATIGPGRGLCLGPDGTIYFSDRYRVRKLARDPDGQLRVTSLAGMSKINIRYQDGPGEQARFGSIGGIAMDRSGALLVTDSDNSLIRKLVFDAAGKATVSTIAGKITPIVPGWIYSPLSGYVDGPAAKAMFAHPIDVEVADDGSLLVTDSGNHAIRRVARDAAGDWQVSTLIGPGQGMQDGPFPLARLNFPTQLEPDGPGRYLCIDGRFPTHQLRTIRMGASR